MNITDTFINYIDEMARSPLPSSVETKAKQALLDYLGVAYGGAFEAGDGLEAFFHDAQGSCSVLGRDGVRTDARTAAFANGFHAHLLELDDGHRFGMLHLGAVIISAILAIAQQDSLSFEQMLKGIVLGYEAAARIAIGIQPGHKKRGYHTTGTCGSIGAAIGCAVALKMDKEQLKTVLSVAGSGSAGLLEIQENASQLKAYNVAHAAMSGVTAAIMGKSGLRGPDDILGGDRGFLAIHSATVSAEKLISKEDYFEIERIYVKPYAACRHCHSALEAVLRLKKQIGASVADIDQIQVDTYDLAIRGHDHTEIKGVQSAKLSMPYSVAAACVLETAGVGAYTKKTIKNEEILDLARKVVIRENATFSAQLPQRRIAEVTLITKDGQSVSSRVDYAKGDPENPMSDEEILTKFTELMTWCGKSKKAEKITELFRSAHVTSKELFSIL